MLNDNKVKHGTNESIKGFYPISVYYTQQNKLRVSKYIALIGPLKSFYFILDKMSNHRIDMEKFIG